MHSFKGQMTRKSFIAKIAETFPGGEINTSKSHNVHLFYVNGIGHVGSWYGSGHPERSECFIFEYAVDEWKR